MDLTPPTTESLPPQPEHKIVDLHGNPARDLEIIAKEKEDEESKRAYCMSHHKNVLVDDHLRTIECRECGRVLDPFDYILGWCNQGETRMHHLKTLDAEIRHKYGELKIVKDALAREKAKVRRINPDALEVQTWQRFRQQRERAS